VYVVAQANVSSDDDDHAPAPTKRSRTKRTHYAQEHMVNSASKHSLVGFTQHSVDLLSTVITLANAKDGLMLVNPVHKPATYVNFMNANVVVAFKPCARVDNLPTADQLTPAFGNAAAALHAKCVKDEMAKSVSAGNVRAFIGTSLVSAIITNDDGETVFVAAVGHPNAVFDKKLKLRVNGRYAANLLVFVAFVMEMACSKKLTAGTWKGLHLRLSKKSDSIDGLINLFSAKRSRDPCKKHKLAVHSADVAAHRAQLALHEKKSKKAKKGDKSDSESGSGSGSDSDSDADSEAKASDDSAASASHSDSDAASDSDSKSSSSSSGDSDDSDGPDWEQLLKLLKDKMKKRRQSKSSSSKKSSSKKSAQKKPSKKDCVITGVTAFHPSWYQ
jgi:hypothetical protein